MHPRTTSADGQPASARRGPVVTPIRAENAVPCVGEQPPAPLGRRVRDVMTRHDIPAVHGGSRASARRATTVARAVYAAQEQYVRELQTRSGG